MSDPAPRAERQGPAACQCLNVPSIQSTEDGTTVVLYLLPPFVKQGPRGFYKDYPTAFPVFICTKVTTESLLAPSSPDVFVLLLFLESLAPQIPHPRTPQLDQLRDHAAAHRGAGGGELGGRHQKHRAAAGPRGDVR